MSGSELSGCVTLVVSAFRDGAEIVGALHKTNRKRKGERRYQEILVHHTLDQSWRQIQTRYNIEIDKFGEIFQNGDETARDQLLCIAVTIHADIIRSLQIATENDQAVLDLVQLHEFAVTSRHDAVRALDDLCNRLESSWPLKPDHPSVLGPQPLEASPRTRTTSLSCGGRLVPGQMPRAVTMTETRERRGVSRLLPGSSNARRRNSMALATPNLAWLGTKPLPPLPNNGKTSLDSPALSENGSSISSHSNSIMSFGDDSFDTLPSTISKGSLGKQPASTASRFELYANGMENTEDIVSMYDDSATISSSPVSPLSSGAWTIKRRRASSFLSIRRTTPPDLPDRPTTPPTTATTTIITSYGRPCKKNNYWGFCKGAWAAVESVSTGLSIRTLPDGLYGRTLHWACNTCAFQSAALNRKKEIPDKIWVSGCGIAYRWLFLARSHVKAKQMTIGNDAYWYGCMFCAAASTESSLYCNVETLMEHIAKQHAGRLSREARNRTRCIAGRTAERDEVWDINIPARIQVR